MEISLFSAYAKRCLNHYWQVIEWFPWSVTFHPFTAREMWSPPKVAKSNELFSPTSAGAFELFMKVDLIHVPWIDGIISMNRLAQYSFTQVKKMVLHVSVLLICVPVLSLLIWHACISRSNSFNYVPFFFFAWFFVNCIWQLVYLLFCN